MDPAQAIAAVPPGQPLRVIIGAGEQCWDGWIPTQREHLDLRDRRGWERMFRHRRADAFLCEHVWEHLDEAEGRAAARLCFEFLRPGGFLRVAVPDRNFPDAAYQASVQVGGPGPADHPAADHRIVYDHRLFADVFERVGFEVDLLEYCDEAGRLHYRQWAVGDGPVYRSLLLDHRNRGGRIGFTSLILDARKPAMARCTGA
jgi:predicted SAM-dependent methyltransferase